MSQMDWSALKKFADDSTKPAPVGEYVVEVKKCDAANAQSSGNPMLKAQLVICDGPSAGKSVPNNFNLTVDNGFAMSIFFRHMAAFGLDDKFFAGQPSIEQVAATLVGRRARVQLSIRTWQGRELNQVDNVMPLTGGSLATVPAPVGGPQVPTPSGPAVPATPSQTPSTPTPSTVPTVPGPPPAVAF